jgi:peroxiredoxin
MRLLVVLLLTASGMLSMANAAQPESKTAESAAALELEPVRLEKIDLVDFRGRTWTLEDFQEDKILVVAFMGTECPLAQHYAIRLQELADKYRSRGVAVVAVMSNRQDSLEEIASYAQRQKIEFPVLKDAGNRLADHLGADRTPELYVFDSDRNVRYRGRVDDQYGIGYIREAARRHDLVAAIDELLAGKPVSVPRTQAVGCIIGRAKPVDEDSEVTFGSHVAAILYQRCVECHREGEIAPFALTDHDEVAGWADMIAEVVREGRMPPWHASEEHAEFKNDRRLSDEEKQAIYDWADAGAPAGDLSSLPPLPENIPGWQLSQQPDLVLSLTEEPFQVPATGEVKYQYFSVDPGFTEDKWVKAFEVKPGNRAVVHHILGFTVDKGQKRVGLQAALGFKFGFVPGTGVTEAGPGHAMLIPAGSHLLFQVHYVSVGTPQTDHSQLGLVFADPAEVTHEVIISSAYQLDIRIPPGADHHVITSAGPAFPPDSTLLGMNPHMHVRGKSYRYELETPDGKRTTLLDVPNYDFNWQTMYMLKHPLQVPTGSRLLCEAVFDNSEDNLNNPNPKQWVRFGDQTWEEMMIGYYVFAVPLGRTESGFTRSQIAKKNEVKSTLLMFFQSIDRDNDGVVAKNQMPGPLAMAFDSFNKNKDDVLTLEEVRDGEIPLLLEMLLMQVFKM